MSNTFRSFPRTCFACQAKRVMPAHIPHQRDVKYDGKMVHLDVAAVPVERCEACSETTFGSESEEVLDAALRNAVGLLTPEQIRKGRVDLGLTQAQIAEFLGCAQESISRWENGLVVQSRSADRMFRVFFGVPEARSLLSRVDLEPALGTVIVHESARLVRWPTPKSIEEPIAKHYPPVRRPAKSGYTDFHPTFRRALTPVPQEVKNYARVA